MRREAASWVHLLTGMQMRIRMVMLEVVVLLAARHRRPLRGNLSWQTTSEQLKDIFESYGPTSAEVQVGRDGRSRAMGC